MSCARPRPACAPRWSGIGLARFAYTPLLPALIEGGWFSPPDAAYLAAANLVGYLVGAIGARPVMSRMRPTRLVRLMMLLATATFFACALRLGFPWFVFWRFLSGLSGGLLMVAVAPTVLAVDSGGPARARSAASCSPGSASASSRPAPWCRNCCAPGWSRPGSGWAPWPCS